MPQSNGNGVSLFVLLLYLMNKHMQKQRYHQPGKRKAILNSKLLMDLNELMVAVACVG